MRAALPLLEVHGFAARVVVCGDGSEPARHATEAAAAGADLVVAIGGDGHAAAVAGGLIGSTTTLAVLPAGSANDYAVALGMPHRDVAASVAAIAADCRTRVDTMRVENGRGRRHFLNVVGTGFDAVVAATAERIPFLRGAGRYVLAILRELPRFSAATMRITLDGECREVRAMMVALANGSSYGGGMRVAPEARLDSGWLEVCIVGEISKLEFMRAFPRVFHGTHVDHPAVTMLRAREILLEADRSLALTGDGDVFGRLPARVSVEPASLSVVVGAAPG